MTTDYELAKEMKAKGFPQHEYCESYYCWANACNMNLSDLWEACGHRLISVEKLGEELFRAKGHTDHTFSTKGKSPEEAAFRFWLELRPNERNNISKHKTR